MVEESIYVVFNESPGSLNSGVDISKVRLEELSLSDKRKEEKKPAYVEVEEIRIRTADDTGNSVPVQPGNAGTEHLEQEDVLQETVENLEDQVQTEEV